VTGGAWTIGYKAWGALFGRRLSQRGVLVFCLDYRNFPQGGALEMLQDVNTGVKWVLGNAELYGGDPERVFLIGQSAGGHLTSLALLAQATQASNGNGDAALGASPAWELSRLRAYVGVSGAYNLVTLADHLHRRGLYRNMFSAIMSGPDGSPMLDKLSPSEVAARLSKEAARLLPPVLLLHGTADRSVPIENAEEYYKVLVKSGVSAQMKAYIGKTHTQPIVEDPMRGGQDKLMDEVLSLIRGEVCVNRQFPMLPSVLIDAATFVCPF
jgi:prenylcysteine alpha-carboxyl methylesterase